MYVYMKMVVHIGYGVCGVLLSINLIAMLWQQLLFMRLCTNDQLPSAMSPLAAASR